MAKKANTKKGSNKVPATPHTSDQSVAGTDAKVAASSSKTKKRAAEPTPEATQPSSKQAMTEKDAEDPQEALDRKKQMLMESFTRVRGKSKCHGCRISGSAMPSEPVGENETQLLECGCDIQGALLEMVLVKLGMIGEDVAQEKIAQGEKSGWKCMNRPERERMLKVFELMGMDLDQFIMMIQE